MKIRDLQQPINEIDRRGFLKGLGATAAAGATGSAMAAPFRHSKNVDPMTGKENGKYSEVRSDNSNAVLSIQWPEHKWPGVFIDIPRGIINFGVYGASGRIKINGKVADVSLSRISNRSYSSASIDIPPRTVLTATGDLWVEVPIYNDGDRVFKFTIEPDSITKAIPAPAPKKPEVKKDKPEDMRQSNLDRMSGNSSPSAGYAGRIIARIKPNITFTDDVQGNPKAEVEVRATTDGTIINRKLLSSSGNKAWDEAVLRAIDKTETLPRDENGRVPSSLHITFRPKY